MENEDRKKIIKKTSITIEIPRALDDAIQELVWRTSVKDERMISRGRLLNRAIYEGIIIICERLGLDDHVKILKELVPKLPYENETPE